MTKIKITSNPYEQTIIFHHYNETTHKWEENPSMKLKEDITDKQVFLPFKAKEIVDTIIQEFHNGRDKIEILFEGTDDEFGELDKISKGTDVADKIFLGDRTRVLVNASDIIGDIERTFLRIRPIIIENSSSDVGDVKVSKALRKIEDSLNKIVPICVVGNFSTGKSTFINALIGHEILPQADGPATAKIYKIMRSNDNDIGAVVKFDYRDIEFELRFDGSKCKLITGDENAPIIQAIFSKVDECADVFVNLCHSVEAINAHDTVGDIITISVPFSEEGVLGRSENNFMIFDTPGDNSQSYEKHADTLKKALDDMSNGIPVWVSAYTLLDSKDNFKLSAKLWESDALDRRFTMIVLNLADGIDVKKYKENKATMLEWNAVKKMYSNGIYLLSSLMGLGAKIGGRFIDDHLGDLYEEKLPSFSDSTKRSYKELYEYNVMPAQIYDDVIKKSKSQSNLVYANSGLYCIEQAMDDFASRYAAYNKCAMVSKFIVEVFTKVNENIARHVAELKDMEEKLNDQLEDEKQDLLKQINKASDAKTIELYKASQTEVELLIKRNESSCDITEGRLQNMTNALTEELDKSEREEQAIEEDMVKDDLKNDGRMIWDDLSSGKFRNSWNRASKVCSNLTLLVKAAINLGATDSHNDEIISRKVMDLLGTEYVENINGVKNIFKTRLRDMWKEYVIYYREMLENIITSSSTLTSDQQQNLASTVADFCIPDMADTSLDQLIVEKYFNAVPLRKWIDSLESTLSHLLYRLDRGSKQLNNRALSSAYNKMLRGDMNDMANLINERCFDEFKKWQTQLMAIIEQNIIELNPLLSKIASEIRHARDELNKLENDHKTLVNANASINDMMSWQGKDIQEA